ncbi:hypothetical protein [Arsenicicoccus dermatophilus]|uniref:hypothetical protein n=1 Tax=Arsenicicoccus dermatophilus TaxID=1076331 RepID=UPI001F4C804A|nr:hypothetical protein [Arsenicicoccus dermatophilus]MCH8613485.1 hypothetical protein [Arsenicicoccus dermatophilus]
MTDGTPTDAELEAVRVSACRAVAEGADGAGVMRRIVAEHRVTVGHVHRRDAAQFTASAASMCS